MYVYIYVYICIYVYIYICSPSALRVEAESAELARVALVGQLSRLRLRLLHRAREGGGGPFAALNEQTVQLVCDFLGAQRPRPPSGAGGAQ